jgi:hypothetical protein
MSAGSARGADQPSHHGPQTAGRAAGLASGRRITVAIPSGQACRITRRIAIASRIAQPGRRRAADAGYLPATTGCLAHGQSEGLH